MNNINANYPVVKKKKSFKNLAYAEYNILLS